MKQKTAACFFLALLVTASALQAQQFNSVPLGHDAYTLIELGILRGIIAPPPSVKPWSEFIIREKLREMLYDSRDRLSRNEQDIVSNLLSSFERKSGLDLKEGRKRTENTLAGHRFSFETALNWDSFFTARVPDPAIGAVNKGNLSVAGDMGEHFSWNFTAGGGAVLVEREYMGMRKNAPYVDPKYGDYDGNPNSDGHYYSYDIPPESELWSPVYSIPGYFPYTFTKPWESAVFPPDELGDYIAWPEKFSFFYEIISEMNASFFDNRMYMRFGRMQRDWGPESNGSSLFMNAGARPFMAFEGTAIPLSWLRFSFLTGALEYAKEKDQWTDAEPFQNLFTLAMLEADTGKHFHFDFGSATVWPKRLDLGYAFPLNSNFMYQNNVGDFDNLALFLDLEFRIANTAKIWGSLFVDEIRPDAGLGRFFKLNRNMYAYQGGIKANVGWLPFATLTVRYSKVEPYCYTHEYTETPWNRLPTDTSYVNNGESLGFYLPPNSDELLLRLESMINSAARAHVQYQLIRHGVEYGYGAIDGSSLKEKIIKSDNTEKSFLNDEGGVYRWDHVLKFGGAYSLKTRNIPLSFYGEAGLVVTRFTIGDGGSFESLDNAVYRSGSGFIFNLGFKVYP